MKGLSGVVAVLMVICLVIGPLAAPVAAGPPDPTTVLAAVYEHDPTFTAYFSRDDGAWSTESDKLISRFYERRAYHLEVSPKAGIGMSTAGLEVADLVVEVSATQVAGPAESGAGLAFRLQDPDNFYLFVVGDGQFAFYKVVNGTPEELVALTPDDAINGGTGAENRLGVLAVGPLILLFANDEAVAALQDQTFVSGDVGLAVVTDPGPNAEFAFDDLELWDVAQLPADLLAGLAPGKQAAPELTMAVLDEVRAGEPASAATFGRGEGPWSTEEDPQVTCFVERRTYHVLVDAAEVIGISTAGLDIADFYVEGSVMPVDGPVTALGGLVFRYQDSENYYFFGAADGAYLLEKVVDGTTEQLIELAAADAIEAGADAFNRLGIYADGTLLTLVANDTLLTTVDDGTFLHGDIGVAVRTGKDAAEYSFDDIEQWDLLVAAEPEPLAEEQVTEPEPAEPQEEEQVTEPEPAEPQEEEQVTEPEPAEPQEEEQVTEPEPAPAPKVYTVDDFEIEWGPMGVLYEIENPRIEERWLKTQLGQAVEATVLAFSVTAAADITFGVFMAHFYDANGDEVGIFSPVIFEEPPDFAWSPGMKSPAMIILDDEDLETIKRIEIKQFM
ncbi:MAG: hypothetical protein H3C34_26015 [Caldilineaceae bacterium]|nr:hypothetical protein [Caldilineaceae bacterium]